MSDDGYLAYLKRYDAYLQKYRIYRETGGGECPPEAPQYIPPPARSEIPPDSTGDAGYQRLMPNTLSQSSGDSAHSGATEAPKTLFEGWREAAESGRPLELRTSDAKSLHDRAMQEATDDG